jgi:8-oxo-dGTP diphosphatase
MNTRQRVTLFIWQDEKLLVIRRWRNGRSFIVIPGGGVEAGESPDEAALREALEETSLRVTLDAQMWTRPFITPIEDGKLMEQIEYAYRVTHFNGEPHLNLEEFQTASADNRYELAWVSRAELSQLPTYPGPLPPLFWETQS